MSRKDDRRNARREAVSRDKDEKETGVPGGNKYKNEFIVSQDIIDKLGIAPYATVSDGGDKPKTVVGEVHILPAHEDDIENGLDVVAYQLYYHTEVGPNEANILCPKRMKEYLQKRGAPIPEQIQDGKCPICEEHDRMLKEFFDEKDDDRKEALQDIVKSLRSHAGEWKYPQPKALLCWVVDAENEDNGTNYWIMPSSIYYNGIVEEILDYENRDEKGEPGFKDLQDTDDGYTFVYKNKGRGFDRYHGFRTVAREFSIATEEPDWLKLVPRWEDILVFHSYEEIAAMFTGADMSSADDEPKRDRTRKPRERSSESSDESEPRRRRERTKEPDVYEDETPEKEDEPEDDVSDAVQNARRRRREVSEDTEPEEGTRRRRRSRE